GIVRHIAYLLEAISLRRMAKVDGINHIHTHFSTNATAVALLCERLGGPGYSFTAHGPTEFVDWGASSLAMKVDGARFVVAISHFCTVQLTLAAGMSAWDKIHIVGCGLDLEEFDISDAPFAADAPFVVVGRLCPEKAQVLIVEAVAKLAATHPEVRVELIGDGASRAEVEAAITRHGVADQITLLGWRDNKEVRARLGAARALLLPSFAEGLPVVIMEAFATGRPAISTYIAGIPELVDAQSGWIIPAGSSDAIAEAMRAAIDTPPERLAAMGREGRARVEARHDVKKNAARLADLFRHAIAASGAASRET
ncbi:MAG: glycosyltransferase, partial [Rhodobacteraceae bacterium]|nr:glycosyltransferase [Paracoccaceae bacterium]